MWSESSWSNLLRSFAWLCRCFLCVWQNRGQTLYLGLLFLAKTLMFLILFEHESSESLFWFINLIVWTQRNNLELRPLFRKVHAQVFLLWIPPTTVQSVWRTPTCTTRLFRDTRKPMHLPLQGLGMVGSCGLPGLVGSAPCSYLNEVWWRALLVSTDLSVAEEPQHGQRRMGLPAPEQRWCGLSSPGDSDRALHCTYVLAVGGVAVLLRTAGFRGMPPCAVSFNNPLYLSKEDLEITSS